MIGWQLCEHYGFDKTEDERRKELPLIIDTKTGLASKRIKRGNK